MILLSHSTRTAFKIMAYSFLAMVCFASAMLLAGCGRGFSITTTTTVVQGPEPCKKVTPIVLQRQQQYNDSARVLSIRNDTYETIYTIAVRKNAKLAIELLTKSKIQQIRDEHNKEWENLPSSPVRFNYK
jgi:hypothetical protein